jgi:hypothetical protein
MHIGMATKFNIDAMGNAIAQELARMDAVATALQGLSLEVPDHFPEEWNTI